MSLNNRRNSSFIVIGALIIGGLVLMFQWVLQDDEYLINTKRAREKKVEMLRTDPGSPIPDSLKKRFTGLDFFPVNKRWRKTARFKKNPKFQRFRMPKTDGTFDEYVIAGKVEFDYEGKQYQLTAYNPNREDSKTLFIPFRDATSGKETYGGGRYIDTRLLEGSVIVDFNEAYNPYCVYDYYNWACPVPPEENRLPFPVDAGERTFEWEGLF